MPNKTQAVKTKTKIATISFKTLAATTGTNVIFANGTQVLSVATGDQAGENVLLSNPSPAIVTLTEAVTTPGPTAGPTVTGAPTSSNITCTGLGLDRSATGSAPYSITFTGSATANTGTIAKASFNFGEGAVEDETQSGGLGTKSVNVQKSHTYNNPGSYTANVLFTGSDNFLSILNNNCTKIITVNPTGLGGPPTGTQSAQITPSSEVGPTTEIPPTTEQPPTAPIPTVAPTGPSPKLIGIGIAGIIISVIGGLLIFAL